MLKRCLRIQRGQAPTGSSLPRFLSFAALLSGTVHFAKVPEVHDVDRATIELLIRNVTSAALAYRVTGRLTSA